MKQKFNVRWSAGEQVLRDPSQNRDAAFTRADRRRLGVEGLLPPTVMTIQQQVGMELEHIFSKATRSNSTLASSRCWTGTRRFFTGSWWKTSSG